MCPASRHRLGDQRPDLRPLNLARSMDHRADRYQLRRRGHELVQSVDAAPRKGLFHARRSRWNLHVEEALGQGRGSLPVKPVDREDH